MEKHQQDRLETLWDAHTKTLGIEEERKRTQERFAALLRPFAKLVLVPIIATTGTALLALAGWLQHEFWAEKGRAPLGAVIAWPIELEIPDGWHACNGDVVDAPEELRVRLLGLYDNTKPPAGKIKLPDFQGRFLRGRGGDAAAIGIPQDWMTGLPRAGLTADDGEHSHSIPRGTQIPEAGDGRGHFVLDTHNNTSTGGNGAHHHSITGGDPETRPKNYAVHWIMRIK